MSGTGMNRRAFLTSAPRQLWQGVQALMAPVAVPTATAALDDAHTGHRRMAVLDVSLCLAWGAGSCQLCYLRCPLRERAMVIENGRPVVVASACDGCGVCVEVCRTVNDLAAMQIVAGSFAAVQQTDNHIARLSEPTRLTSS